MDTETAFKIFAGVSTFGMGIMAGSAVYINTIEHPSRMTIEDVKSSRQQWKGGFDIAKKIQFTSSFLIDVAAAGACYCDHTKGKPIAIAATMIAMNLPYTLLFLKPNSIDPIYEDSVLEEKSEDFIRDKINAWNNYHKVRTVVDCAAFGYTLYNLLA